MEPNTRVVFMVVMEFMASEWVMCGKVRRQSRWITFSGLGVRARDAGGEIIVGRKRRVTLKFLRSYLCMSKKRELTLSLTRMVGWWWWCFARARETLKVHAVRASKTTDCRIIIVGGGVLV